MKLINGLKVILILLCFYLNWLWVDFASEMDLNIYTYAQLWVFALVQYTFASIGLYSILIYIYNKYVEHYGDKQ